jgi:hypothetical protein
MLTQVYAKLVQHQFIELTILKIVEEQVKNFKIKFFLLIKSKYRYL